MKKVIVMLVMTLAMLGFSGCMEPPAPGTKLMTTSYTGLGSPTRDVAYVDAKWSDRPKPVNPFFQKDDGQERDLGDEAYYERTAINRF